MDSLKDKTAKGLLWGALNNGLQQILNLAFGIVLARLLLPEDYGMVGMLLIFSTVAGAIEESGFTQALINRPRIDDRDYNAVFWFSLLLGLLLYAVLFFCAPLIARFYHQAELLWLSRLLFMSFVVGSLSAAHNARLLKTLRIKQGAIIQVSSLALAGSIGVAMALLGMSYWGIALQTVCYSTFVFIGRSIASGFRPSLRIDFSPIREMMRFSLGMLGANIVNIINQNILTVVLGRMFTPHDVGSYTQAAKWNQMGSYTLQNMLGGVAQPVLREVAGDDLRTLRVFRKLLRFAAFASMPAMLGLSLVAPELIRIAIGSKWAASASLMRIVCLSGAFVPLSFLMQSLLLSRSRSDVCLKSTVALGLAQLAAVVGLHSLGLRDMLWGFVGVSVAWTIVWWRLVRREIPLSLMQFSADILPFFSLAAASALAAEYAAGCVAAPGGEAAAEIWARLAVKAAVMAAAYVGVLWLLKAEILRETIAAMRSRLHL